MKLVQYLKALADLTFLYCTFGTVLAMMFPHSGGWIAPALLAVVAVLGYLLRGKAYRYGVLLLGAVGLVLSSHTAGRVMVAVALLYLALAMKKEGYHYASMEEVDRFRLQIKIILGVLFLGYVLGGGAVITATILPIALIYLVSNNLLLRTLQGGEEAMESPALLRFNLVSLVGVMVAAAVLTSQQVLSALGSGVTYLYQCVIFPLIMGLLQVLFWVVGVIYDLLAGLFNWDGELEATEVTIDIASAKDTFNLDGTEQITTPAWLSILGVALGVAIVLGVLIFIMGKLLGNRGDGAEGDYVTVTTVVGEGGREKERPTIFRSPRDKVRRYYAEFISYAKKQGVMVERSTDTAQLEDMYGATAETAQLRDCYRRARYDHETPVDKGQVAQAKEALKAIKTKGRK